MDGDRHRTLRDLVTSYMTRSRLDAVAERLEKTSDALVRSLLEGDESDLVSGLAEPLVLEGILTMMEIPAERREALGELTRAMLGILEPDLPPAARRRAASAALRATLLFERDGAAGKATGLHAVLEAAAREGTIPVKVARSTPVVVLHGGYENPLNQLGCVVAWAVENPERFTEAAAAAPAVLFEEIMRVYSPVRLVARWAASDDEHDDGDDQPLRQGQFVWVDLESANHDPGRFAAPGEPDLSKKRGHLGFGYGRHICPGAALARLQGQVLIRSLQALPAGALREFTVEWRGGVVARGPMTIARR
jgi:cytochrome P450